MGKQIILGKNVVVGTLCGILMLGGCAFQSEEVLDGSEWLVEEPAENAFVPADPNADVVPDLTVETTQTVCSDGSCAQTENYLTNQFVQEKTLDLSSDTAPLAISRPAGQEATSVRDKMAEKETEGETVWFTAVAVPEKTDEEVVNESVTEETVETVETEKPEVQSTEKETTEETVETEKTEVQPTEKETTEETVVTVDQKPITVETTTETAVQVETKPGETAQVVPVIPAGMVPLKKVTTTITETTTKYQKERKTAESAEPQTLEEKVAYGQEVHDWMADSGNTLRKLLLAWGNKSGWTVVWKLDRDYRLEAGVIFRGTFTEVSAALIRSFARATPPPIGTFYQGNRVLVISTQEDDNER